MDKTFDASNPNEVKKRKTKAQLKREREIEEFKQILSTYGGRAYVWRLLELCGVYRTSFTGNSTTFLNEGKRQIGLHVIEDIFASDPHAYAQIRIEAEERNKNG
jgi:hypothetical protein